jgi:hypothetical protein
MRTPPPSTGDRPLPPAQKNFQDKLGTYSVRSLSNVDSSELTAIHPDKMKRSSHLTPTMKTPPLSTGDRPFAPAQKNFQEKLAPHNNRMSLSSVDSQTLTAIHPNGVNRRPTGIPSSELPSQRYFNRVQEQTPQQEAAPKAEEVTEKAEEKVAA